MRSHVCIMWEWTWLLIAVESTEVNREDTPEGQGKTACFVVSAACLFVAGLMSNQQAIGSVPWARAVESWGLMGQ